MMGGLMRISIVSALLSLDAHKCISGSFFSSSVI